MINEDSGHQCPTHLYADKPLTFSTLLPLQCCLSICPFTVQTFKWSQQDSNL